MTRPYLFTWEHRDELPTWNGTWLPQTVPDGAAVQIQLLSDPVRWNVDPAATPSGAAAALPRSRVTPTGSRVYPYAGQMDSTSAITAFDYRLDGPGVAVICLRPDRPVTPGTLGFPPGTPPYFVLTVLVGIPQATLG